ncbi:snake venom 5'-nucleotidase-like isoform X2 [Ostrea edulis]|uniref:snake venom 5'-nucleotidase-like isoform X2 n=1 Tax=Ostrea edulis TaxID=37623 RepID=UPI0024AF5CF6|nr:snake venom 5'-nucleotidase-like isoform X2 [Ostrea edulis]
MACLYGVFCVLCSFMSMALGEFDLTILHTNDIHARVQEMNAFGGQCTGSDCYGGVARMKTKAEEIRGQFPNTLFVDAGDQFQGTLWFNYYGGNISAITMNELGYDVMALGNHEFDRKIEGVLPFLKKVNFPVLSANIDTSLEPSIVPYVRKSYIAQVGGQQIGIVGYTTKDTTIISSPGTPPSNEKPAGEYPHVVQKAGGERTLVVQDYAFGKYLGFLQVEFDDNGKVTNYGGNPILLNNSIAENTELKGKVDLLYSAIQDTITRVVGRTLVTLEGGEQCRLRECNMGNAIADGLVYHNLKDADDVNGTRVYIALINSGSIRTSFSRGQILLGNIFEVQPFRNTLETIQLQGKYLRETLEHSASAHNVADPDGAFLQFSGLRVKYNLNKPVNQRVVEVKVLCSDCEIPKYEPLEENKMYDVILSNFILLGGDGYTVVKDHAQQKHIVGNLDIDAFAAYVEDFSPLYTSLENRIEFVDNSYPCGTSGGATTGLYFYTTLLFLLSVRITHYILSL